MSKVLYIMETRVHPSKTIEIRSLNFNVCLGLQDERFSRKYDDAVDIPRKYDIKSLVIVDPHDCLEKIRVLIGKSVIMTFDREDFSKGQNILPMGLYLTKSTCMYSELEFIYNKDYIEEHSEYVWQDEYKEEVITSDTEEEYYDGCDYHYGYRVTRKQVPTGQKIKVVTKGPEVTVPELRFTIQEASFEDYDSVSIPFWETIRVDPSVDTEYIRKLVTRNKFQTLNGMSIDEAIENGKPFNGRVENILRYSGGMASKLYVF